MHGPISDPEAIPLDAVPVLVDESIQPLSSSEQAVVERLDGMTTIDEIARDSMLPVATVREVVMELVFQGAVVLDELITVDDIDLLDDPPETEPAEAIVLRRRREGDVRAPLVRAVLEALAALEPNDRNKS